MQESEFVVHACAGIQSPPAVCGARDLIRKRVNNERDVRHTMPNNDETLQLQITCSASLCHCAAAARDKNKPQHARHRPPVGRLELFAHTHHNVWNCSGCGGRSFGRSLGRRIRIPIHHPKLGSERARQSVPSRDENERVTRTLANRFTQWINWIEFLPHRFCKNNRIDLNGKEMKLKIT